MNTFLSSVSIFSGLQDENFAALSEHAHLQSFEKNDIVFQTGSAPDFLYVVRSGHVQLFNLRQNTKKEETVCMIQPGGFFCLAPVVRNEPLQINARAIEPTELILIPRQILMQLIDGSHAFAKKVIHFLAGKECELCEEVCDLSLATTKERLAKFLVKSSFAADSGASFVLPMNQSQMASKLGTVRETLARDLSGLKKAGIVSIEDQVVTIHDFLALKNLAGGSL